MGTRLFEQEHAGMLLCLIAAFGFSTVAIFTKLAYQAGVGIGTLLLVRSFIAALSFWLIWALRRVPLPDRQMLGKGLLLGLVGSSLQVWMLASSLARIDAALASLLFYTYPAIVMVGAVLLGREHATLWNATALGASGLGVLLVLSDAGTGVHVSSGIIFALAAALACACNMLAGHTLMTRIQPLTLAALVSTGSAIAYLVASSALRSIDFTFQLWGWLPLLGMAVFSSVIASGSSLAGIQRAGPTRASIIMMSELPMTVLLAVLLFGDQIRTVQILGGVLILTAIVLLTRSRAH